MEDSKVLIIPQEDYERNYNLDITPYVKADPQGNDYISWAIALKLLRNYNPNLAPELVKTETLYGENAPTGTILHVVIKNITTGFCTPVLHYPIMEGFKSTSVIYPDARDITDNLMRAYVKAIAIYTGLGYRLYTREGVDLPGGGKEKNRAHFKFKALTQINSLIDELEAQGIDYEGEKPNFGMTSFELKEIGATLKQMLGAPSNNIVPTNTDPVKSWKTIEDALNYASKTLNISVKEADKLFQETEPDANGKKMYNYYNKIVALSK